MTESPMSVSKLKQVAVWDRTTRWFHWLNVLCITGLAGVGLVILNDDSLGVSDDGKFLLKTVHVYIGYVFMVNLGWRLLWGFIGTRYARWRAILPFGGGYWRALKTYIAGVKAGAPPQYLGHNPLAKLMVGLLFLLLATQAITGLVLAGTDLYLPPFGHEIAEWVTASGEEHDKIVNLKPGAKGDVDSDAYAEMRLFRKPFITAHVYAFYVLVVAIILHIAGVIFAELKEKNGLVSAMFTGNKVISKPPVDE